ncbi:MAG TPA: NAD(P) transhydrogenase subunit alpha [Micromonosporaceae bacterium]|nr:NAD(P) transhydrogenase subunit alpha [Micromonosporaceae bacterium]
MTGDDRLTVAVPRESRADEQRVALVPDQVGTLRAAGMEVVVETGAGSRAWFCDDAYAAAGATILPAGELYAAAGVVLGVGRPRLAALRAGQVVIGLLRPREDPALMARLAALGVTAISLDELPRTLTRAQPMDALTSQANVAGYKAVLLAANTLGRYLPMLVTAAGTARPARVLVLGAGVAGLQAIGTARRLGAVVSAYDIRPQSRDEARSVGATVLDLTGPDGDAEGGYARALADGEEAALRTALAPHVAAADVVVTTAQVPGRRPPLLVAEEAVKGMAPGSVIVDLAAGPYGGNTALTRAGATVVTDGGVTVAGAGDLAATVPTAASAAYSRNVTALLAHLARDGRLAIDRTDEIQAGVVVTHGGRVVHPVVASLLDSPDSPDSSDNPDDGGVPR